MDRINVVQHKEQCLALVASYKPTDCINRSLDQKK